MPSHQAAHLTADVLLGDYRPTGRLSFTWPRIVNPTSITPPDRRNALFPIELGLTYWRQHGVRGSRITNRVCRISSAVSMAANCSPPKATSATTTAINVARFSDKQRKWGFREVCWFARSAGRERNGELCSMQRRRGGWAGTHVGMSLCAFSRLLDRPCGPNDGELSRTVCGWIDGRRLFGSKYAHSSPAMLNRVLQVGVLQRLAEVGAIVAVMGCKGVAAWRDVLHNMRDKLFDNAADIVRHNVGCNRGYNPRYVDRPGTD